jgi:hypothetical protein
MRWRTNRPSGRSDLDDEIRSVARSTSRRVLST